MPAEPRIFFTTPPPILTFAAVRAVIIPAVFFLSVCALKAQEQEQKLLDRLLKPNTTLQNTSQEKQFALGSETKGRTVATKSFYTSPRQSEKEYGGTRNFPARDFNTEESRFARKQADTSTRNQLAKVNTPYATSAYETHPVVDAKKTTAVSDYPGNRQFTLQGKSQKSLSAQDKQLTIDQVRELLNKNK